MSEKQTEKPSPAPASGESAADARPRYEAPRLARRRAVTRATLFSGGGPVSLPPLLTDG